MKSEDYLSVSASGVRLQVYVQPGASKNQIVGPHGSALKIKIKAPPEDGRANEELIKFLAKTLEVAKSQIELLRGHSSRQKTLQFTGINVDELRERLTKAITPPP